MASQQEGTERTNIRVRGQEMVASGEITQKQLDESLKIYDKTKSMDFFSSSPDSGELIGSCFRAFPTM